MEVNAWLPTRRANLVACKEHGAAISRHTHPRTAQEYQTPATPEQLAAFEANKAKFAQHAPLPDPVQSSSLHPGPHKARPSVSAVQPPRRLHSDVCCSPGDVSDTNFPPPNLPPGVTAELRVGILTVSDRASAGQYADESGPAIRDLLAAYDAAHPGRWRLEVARTAVVPDEQPAIEAKLREWSGSASPAAAAGAEAPCNVILTTGGTGFAPRDVTPEATRAVVERLAPGLMTALAMQAQALEPLAPLSRAVVGLCGATLIANLPGRPRAVRQNLTTLLPVLGQAVHAAASPP